MTNATTTPADLTNAAESFAKVVAIFQVQLAALVAKLAKGEITEADYLAEVGKSLKTIDRLGPGAGAMAWRIATAATEATR